MSVRMFWEVGGGRGRGGGQGGVRPRVRAVRMGVGVGMVATILGALVWLVLSTSYQYPYSLSEIVAISPILLVAWQ